ncbi:GFA family protein, partial [Neisseria sp. P0015.S002]
CLCGAVTLEVPETHELHACHCGKCRTWNGGASFTLTAQSPKISGSEHIGRYSSSEWAQRCFCKECGTHLFVQVGNDYYINAGLFADNA